MLLKRNILATYASQIYGAIIGLALAPLYLRYLGAEAYGLVAFFAILQGWFLLLDMGLTQTMGREAARFQGGGAVAHELRALLRWLEILFAMLALVAGTAIFVGADAIAGRWLNAQRLPIEDIRIVVELMAVTVLLRVFGDLYRGVIAGFEKLMWLGAVGAIFATARFVLVIPWLIWVRSSVVDFFIFQLAIGVIELLVMTVKAYLLLPSSTTRISWSWRPAPHVLGFSFSMGLATIVWVCVSQTDKLLLSGLLSLTGFGWFNLAVAAASGVTLLTGPIVAALAPRLTAMQAQGDESSSLSLYRDATQWVGLLVWSASAVLAVHAEKVMWIWTGNAQAAAESAGILRLYAIGNAMMAVAALPYYLQFAKGQLRLHLAGTGLFVLALVPGLIWAAPRFGGVGAGWVWLAVNAAYLMLWVPVAHARHAPGLHSRWLVHDVAPIALLSAGAGMASYWLPWPDHRGIATLELLGVAGVTLLAAAAGSSWARDAHSGWLKTIAHTVTRAIARIPLGARYHCNICDRRVRRFLPYRDGWRGLPPLSRHLKIVGSDVENFECPACGCHDRERHLLMYLNAAGLLEKMKGSRILHLAPEGHLQKFIGDTAPGEYVLGDLFPNRPDIKRVDLQDICYPDAYFDFVIANHVLEHVQDDGKALAEIARVLRPEGYAILQTPYSPVLSRTFEDPAIETAEACLHAYGQEDHRRLYGRDIAERFASCGLSSRMQDHFALLAGVDPTPHGLNGDEPFFLFQREFLARKTIGGAKGIDCERQPTLQETTDTATDTASDAPLLSILCITYNHESYIKQALDSFLAQEVDFPFEVVIGEDCSTDGTLQVIEEYSLKYPGIIKLLPSHSNLGMSENFRRTMKACHGRYIAICEGDDFWDDPTKLARQVSFLERHPEYVMTFHDARVLDKSGHLGDLQLPVALRRDATADELARSRPISTLTTCFRNLLKDIPVELSRAPVLDLCLWSLLGQFGAGKYIPEIKPAVYRVHDGGVFSSQSVRRRLLMTANTYLCLAQFHENRGNDRLGAHFVLEAACVLGAHLETAAQRRLIRSLLEEMWRNAKARITGAKRWRG